MNDTSRIESLEGQVRTLKRIFATLFGLVIAAGLLAATTLQAIPDVVQAKKFEVLNEDGQVVVQLASNSAGGLVEIKNGKGLNLVRLIAYPEGGTVSAHDGKGRTLLLMGGNEHGSGALQTRANTGKTLVTLGTNQEGEGIVFTQNGQGEQTSSMP